MTAPKPCRDSELEAVREVLIGHQAVTTAATCGERADWRVTLRLGDGLGVPAAEVTTWLCDLHHESVLDHSLVEHVGSEPLVGPPRPPVKT